MAITAGINFHGFGNFIIPLSRDFGWSRTTISAIFSVARLESGLLGPLEGWAVDRVGPRRLMVVGIPLMGLGYIPWVPIDHPDAGHYRRADHQRVRVRHDGQLRIRLPGILRRGHTVDGPGIHGQAAGQACPQTQSHRWLTRLSGASSVCERVHAAIQ